MSQWPLRLRRALGVLGAALAALLVGSVVLALVLLAAAWSLAHHDGATERLLKAVPGLQVTEPKGALLGDFQARRIELALPRGGRLSVVEPAWQGMALVIDGQAPWRVGVRAEWLKARQVHLHWVSGPPAPAAPPPASLALPISVVIDRLQVQQVHSPLWGEGRPFGPVNLGISLQRAGATQQDMPGGDSSAVHALAIREFGWVGWRISGTVKVGAQGQMPVAAVLQLAHAQAEGAWRVQGTLRDIEVQGRLGVRSGEGQAEAAEVSATARVQPFASWPLPELAVRTQELDVSRLWPGAPLTRLQGGIVLKPRGPQGLEADVDMRNAEAGAWDAGRVPMQSLRGRVALDQARHPAGLRAVLEAGEVTLTAQLPPVATQAGTASQMALTGDWRLAEQGGGVTLALQGVHLRALDGRAPPLRLQGEMTARPQIDAGADPADLSRWRAAIKARLRGEARAPAASAMRWPAQPVSLSLDGEVASQAMTVSSLRLQADHGQEARVTDAQVRWGGEALAGAPWSARAAVEVKAFDPKYWLPWPAEMTAATRLDGAARLEVDGRGRGQARVTLEPSVLAGLPVRGAAQWQGASASGRAALSLAFDAAGNAVSLDGNWPVRPGEGATAWWTPASPGQRWRGELKGPALSALQPLLPLVGLSRIGGTVEAVFNWDGHWPRFSTTGRFAASQLSWQTPTGKPGLLQAGNASWNVDTAARDAVLEGLLDVSGIRTALGRVDRARASLSGRGTAHRVAAEADMVLARGPAASNGAPSQPTDMPFHFDLEADGGLVGEGWQGRLQKLVWRSTRNSAQTLLEAQPVSLSVTPEGTARRARLGATRITLMGVTLNLQSLQMLWAGETQSVADADVRVQLPPQNLASLLQRWQPEGGWGGDLMVGGQLQVSHSAAQPWVVDLQLARQSGDLTVSEATIEGNSQQPLGITEARVALQARQGVWRLTQLFEGRVLGRLRGEQVVQVASPERLPSASDPLAGTLDVQIGSLRPWGGWMPAGWRLGGQLQGQASLAGTLGVPQYRGRLQGQRLALAQPLLGVQITDGELLVELEGDHARLTRLRARGGPQGGELRADGEALFGEQVQATLRVQAERFALLQRVDRRVRVSGALQATFGEQDIGLTGQIGVDEGLVDISRSDAPTIGDDVNVLRRPGEPAPDENQPQKPPATPRKLQASVALDLGDALRLRGRGVDTLLTGQLRFTTPNNRPSLTGTVRTAQGTYAAYGQRLVIERGAITFTGPIENPRLDILAMRAQSATAGAIVSAVDVKVGVAITGTAMDPRVSLYSDPALSETEKLSWLVLGRAPSGLGGADIGLLQSAAVALLSGEKSSPSDNLIGRLGLDELSVRQTDGTVRETVVNVGKQVSRFWYVGYERNLNATSGSWQLIYRLGQRMTLRFQAGGDNAVDLIRAWRWD